MATFFKDIKQGKLLGHPIHVMVIHFPMALFPVGFAFDLLSWIRNDASFALIGFYCMGIGLLGAVIASIFGIVDFIKLPDDKSIRQKAVIHACINMIAVFIYLGLFLFRFPAYPDQKIVSPGLNILNGILVISLMISAHYGGELILRHKVGTISGDGK
jgi:uncharacterized membrane protein